MDPLTNVFNRRAFLTLLDKAISNAQRTQTTLPVLVMDLDHFKKVNDSWGHRAGDDVLRHFVMLAQRCLRKEDVMGRLGGEEFAIFLPNAGAGGAIAVAERLRVPLHIEDALKERTYGAFEGRIRDEIRREYGIPLDEPIRAIVPPDAESWAATCERALATVRRWLDRHPADTLLFVSHDGIFRVLHEQLLGTRPSAGNATPYVFQPGGGGGWAVTELRD